MFPSLVKHANGNTIIRPFATVQKTCAIDQLYHNEDNTYLCMRNPHELYLIAGLFGLFELRKHLHFSSTVLL